MVSILKRPLDLLIVTFFFSFLVAAWTIGKQLQVHYRVEPLSKHAVKGEGLSFSGGQDSEHLGYSGTPLKGHPLRNVRTPLYKGYLTYSV